ncbi:hypothetical protein JCM6882_009678 [Rhodosporidiobolus microsporus]
MGSMHVAEQVTGWLGTILWCIQLFPQVWLNYRRKTTHGLSPFLFVCWMFSGAFLGIYAIVENINIPIIVQPHCYGALCAFILCQILHYDRQWKWYAAYLGGFATYAVICAGFEAGLVFALRAAEHKGIKGATMLFGILSDVLLGAGFFPQLYEIYKLKEVVGVSYLFLFMDSLGAVFSIMSLAFKSSESIDVIALCGYVVVIFFEVLVGILAFVLNPRAKARRTASGEETGTETKAALRTDTMGTTTAASYAGTEVDVDVERQEERSREEKEAEVEQVLPQVLPPADERELADRLTRSAA